MLGIIVAALVIAWLIGQVIGAIGTAIHVLLVAALLIAAYRLTKPIRGWNAPDRTPIERTGATTDGVGGR